MSERSELFSCHVTNNTIPGVIVWKKATYTELYCLTLNLKIIIFTRNELASLAYSFYTCLKHLVQLIHLTIVLFRFIII